MKKHVVVWAERVARFGYFTKGLLYCLLGAFTVLAALGIGGEKANRDIIFDAIDKIPMGKILLLLLSIGLLSHSVYRFTQARS